MEKQDSFHKSLMRQTNHKNPKKIVINAEENGRDLGRDLYKYLPDKDKKLISIGMIPKYWADRIEKEWKEKCSETFLEDYNIEKTVENIQKAINNIKQEVIQEFQKGFATGLFEAAEKHNKLIS